MQEPGGDGNVLHLDCSNDGIMAVKMYDTIVWRDVTIGESG